MFFAACEATKTDDVNTPANSSETNKEESKTEIPPTTRVKDGYVVPEEGTAKEKPESGKANVQGKVLFNGEPAKGVEVRLCENFSTISGCTGEEYKTKTDENGEYLIKNVEPKDYSGLLAKVFKTPMYIFAAQSLGIVAAKYKIEPDTTFFAPATNLYKADLKVQNLRPNAKVEAKDFELKWDKYEDAAYYKFSLYPKDSSITTPYYNEKVEGESFKIEKDLPNGEYRLKMEAFNANDVKLSQLKDDIKFNVTGGEEKKEEETETTN